MTAQFNGLSVLAFDGAQLAFPLTQAVTVLQVTAAGPAAQPLALASVAYGGKRWPLFGFDGELQLLTEGAALRQFCVCLSADQSRTGLALLCDTVTTLPLPPEADVTPVPLCLQQQNSPLRYWYDQNTQLLPISTAPALAAYLMQLAACANG